MKLLIWVVSELVTLALRKSIDCRWPQHAMRSTPLKFGFHVAKHCILGDTKGLIERLTIIDSHII